MTQEIFIHFEEIKERLKIPSSAVILKLNSEIPDCLQIVPTKLSPHILYISKETWERQDPEEIVAVIAHELKHLEIFESYRSIVIYTLFMRAKNIGSTICTAAFFGGIFFTIFDWFSVTNFFDPTLCWILFLITKPLQILSNYEEYQCDVFAAQYSKKNIFYEDSFQTFYQCVYKDLPRYGLFWGFLFSHTTHPLNMIRYCYSQHVIDTQKN